MFDHMPGDPTDPSTLFSSLNLELKGLRDEAAVAERRMTLQQATLSVCVLAGVQTVCAAVLVISRRAEGRADLALLITSVIVAASGICGLVGCAWRSRLFLHAFFLTQIVVLSAVAAQWLRSEQAAAKEALYCSEREDAMADDVDFDAMCARSGTVLRAVAIAVGLGVVYASMFCTDLLSEMLQDSLEHADNRKLLDFVWLMYQSTLVGVQRFEDRIHERFEELVHQGFLKAQDDQPSPRRRASK